MKSSTPGLNHLQRIWEATPDTLPLAALVVIEWRDLMLSAGLLGLLLALRAVFRLRFVYIAAAAGLWAYFWLRLASLAIDCARDSSPRIAGLISLGLVVCILVRRFIVFLGHSATDLRPLSAAGDGEARGEQIAANLSEAAPSNPYELLGVEPGASPAELRTHYREQLKLYHPDKVAGLGDEIRAVAHERTLKIKAAFQQLFPDQ